MPSVAVGTTEPEPEPEPKRRRLLDAGGPIEDDETARQKMRDARVFERGVYDDYAGFDPDNVVDIKSLDSYNSNEFVIKPMAYFAEAGDLPMMRWLYVNGADTRDVDVPINFPMYRAALNGSLEVCKWFFENGAAEDVKRRTYPYGDSPLQIAFANPYWARDLSRWLILNGALCKGNDSGDLDVEIMRRDIGGGLPWRIRERKALLEWANGLHRPRTSFLLFLSGTLSSPQQHPCNTRRTASPLQLLGGKPGILELIGDYVGFVRGREACIIRQLTEMLPDLID